MLKILNLHVKVKGKEILKGVSLTIKPGEIHALMGPNGSGKSTLALALMGHPEYEVRSEKLEVRSKTDRSTIRLDRKRILDKSPAQRAKLGLFLAFQNPFSVPGVPLAGFLRLARKTVKGKQADFTVVQFNKLLNEKAKLLGMNKTLLKRAVNDGFSGGEKKKAEMLQALVLEPKYVIFDEIDTGLDVDALKTVARGIKTLVKKRTGILLITHYQRILHYVKPNYVHVLINGRLVKSGDYKLAIEIEKKGYR